MGLPLVTPALSSRNVSEMTLAGEADVFGNKDPL